jgi:WD40 repeat protein
LYAFADGKALFTASGEELSHHAEPGWEVAAAVLSPDQAQCLAWLKYFPSRCCRDRGHRDSPSFKPASPLFVIDTATRKAVPLPFGDSLGGEYRALAASDRWFAVGGVARHAAVFDRRTLARVATLEEDGAWYSFAFSRDGRSLVGVHLGRWLVVHDTERFTRRARIEVLPDGKWISALALHPVLPVAAVSGWDGMLRLYSIAPSDEGRLLFSRELGQATALSFSPRGDELLCAVSGSPNNRIVRLSVKPK